MPSHSFLTYTQLLHVQLVTHVWIYVHAFPRSAHPLPVMRQSSSLSMCSSELQGKGKKAAAVPEEVVSKWTKADVRAVEDRLLALGPHRTADVREQARL